VKVLCGEGVANHTAPESCAATREGRPQQPYERHLTRLAVDGVEGINILEAAIAVLLFDKDLLIPAQAAHDYEMMSPAITE